MRTCSPEEIALQQELAEVYFSPKKTSPDTKSASIARTKHRYREPVSARLIMLTVMTATLLAIVITYVSLAPSNPSTLSQKVRTSSLVRLISDHTLDPAIVKQEKKRWSFFKRGEERKLFFTLAVSEETSPVMNIEFITPLDLTEKTLSITARGARGGEALSITLRDASKRSSQLSTIYLGAQWVKRDIPLAGSAHSIDITKIESITLENENAGSAGSGASARALIKQLFLERSTG